jgi:predicted dehydrogenase
MSKIRVAVVGAGILGSRHARVFQEQPETELVAIVDVNPARADVAQQYGVRLHPDLRTLLANETVDAIVVATPDHLHREPVVAALEAGKHVFVEKPLATSSADAHAIAMAASSSNRVAMVNFSQRFVSDNVWIKKVIDDGLLGKLQMLISVKFDAISVPMGMIRSWSAQTSPIYFMSSHDLDLIFWFLGARPREVFAQETRGVLEGQGIPVHDGLNTLIQFDGGQNAVLHSSWIHPNTYPRVADGTLQLIGSEGALMYDARTRTAEMFNGKGGQKVTFSGPHTADEVGGKITGAFTESVRYFIGCILGQCEPITSPQQSLAEADTQAAAIESLGTKQPVRF